MPIIETKNYSLHYEAFGSGKPLVLVPGFAAGAWLWFRQVDELAKDFRVITFDPRGVSRSKLNPPASISIPLIADDVAAILDDLKIERASVAGTSFGGFVAQEFAVRHPERLDRLILACTSFGGPNHVPPGLEVLLAFSATGNLNSPERIRKYMRPAFTSKFAEAHPETIEEVCQLREENPVVESVYMQQLQAATTFNMETRCADISAQTLVLTGEEDAVVPFQNSLNLLNVIPNARLETVKGGGHLFFIEQAEEFNRIVTSFLKN